MRPLKLTALASVFLLAVSTYASDCTKICSTFERQDAQQITQEDLPPCHGSQNKNSSEKQPFHQDTSCLGTMCLVSTQEILPAVAWAASHRDFSLEPLSLTAYEVHHLDSIDHTTSFTLSASHKSWHTSIPIYLRIQRFLT